LIGDEFLSDRVRQLGLSPIREFFERAAKMSDVVRLEIGDSSFPTPEYIREACKRALDEGITRYTSFSGLRELRAAISEKLARENGVTADPDHEIVITPGGTGAIYQAVQACINPGDEVLLPSPGWPQFTPITKLAGGTPVYYPCRPADGFQPRVENVAPLVSPRTKLIILNSPSNPAGSTIAPDQLEALCQLVTKSNLVLLSDEVYEKILFDGERHLSPASLPGMRERTITVNAFSKAFAMTGWRVGYAAGPAAMIESMAKLNLYTNVHPNSLAQHAAVTALRSASEELQQEMLARYQERRDFVVRRLNAIPGISCLPPKGSIFAFANIEDIGMPSIEFANLLLERGRVAVVPGAGFGPDAEGYMRLCFAQSMEDLEKGMDRIAEVAESLASAPVA
jgi:aminotransferase